MGTFKFYSKFKTKGRERHRNERFDMFKVRYEGARNTKN